MAIEIYTDGSAVAKRNNVNCGKGGIGVVFLINGEPVQMISKGYYPTKIGRMELTAILTALKALDKNQKAIIYSDSKYATNCFNEGWLKKWERNSWSDDIKNKDILQPLLSEYRKFPPGSVTFRHVKGHNNNTFNELADQLASYKNFEEFEKDLDESEFKSDVVIYKHEI